MTQACYSERVDEALLLVANAFRFQVRKGSEIPYLSHLLQVMVTVSEYQGTEEQLIAALLHDYLEDVDGQAGPLLESRFGTQVRDMVQALSDTTEQPKPPWRQRKEAYLAHLCQESPQVRLVSAADKLHNLESILRDYEQIGEPLWERFRGGREGTLWYYVQVVQALGTGWDHPILTRLRTGLARLLEMTGKAA